MKRLFKKFISTFLAVMTAVVACASFAPVTVFAGTVINYKRSFANETITLTLNALTDTNKIYYTLDGSKPSKQANLYKKPIVVKTRTVVRAVEYTKKGKVAASLKTTLNPCTKAPTFSMRCSMNTVAVNIIAPSKDAVIYYTDDGTEPTTNSRKFESQYPVILERGLVVKAICKRPGYAVSETAVFDLERDGYKVPEPMSSEGDTLVNEVLSLINAKRKEYGTEPAFLDSALCEAAAQRAAEISVCFSNSRPDGSPYTTILSDQGISVVTLSESINLVLSPDRAAYELVEALMSSPDHKANALNGGTLKAGIGYYRKDGKTFFALLFIR